jgi:hypothetical protein
MRMKCLTDFRLFQVLTAHERGSDTVNLGTEFRMSTDLYGVRVLEIAPEEHRLRLRVFVVYYDTHHEYHQPIPSDRSFFVRVLCDRDALGDDIADDEQFDEDYIDRNAFRFVDRFEELERRNSPVESYDDYADFYYERDVGWQDEENLVQADYDLYVTKPQYLEPFSVGDSWGTTSYETNADELTREEYLEVPDFGDVHAFTPFPGAETEASTVRALSFSADGAHLLVSNDAGGFRVFSTDDWSVTADVPDAGGLFCEVGWTHDGRVAIGTGDGFDAIDLQSGEREPFAPFGWSANAAGTRFLNGPESETATILNETGEVLFERERSPGRFGYAGFDAAGDHCALAMESEPLRLIDLKTGATEELGHAGLNSVALSPDGRYILASNYQGVMVLRAETGEAIRSMKTGQRIPTAVAWSPDGRLAATTVTDERGYHSKVRTHRLGRDVLAAENAPLRVPERAERDITDLVKLYLARTDDFSRGWSTHLDDDLLDFHLALVRMGFSLDLVGQMSAKQVQIAARAYEAQIAHCGGRSEEARAALDDAMRRLEAFEVPDWSHTFVHAPIAAAQYLLGDPEAAEASLQLARVALENEANQFQKRAVLARALLAMERIDEVDELIREETASWLTQFHQRLLTDLIDAGEYDVLKEALGAWGFGTGWETPTLVHRALLENEAFERATSLAWLGSEKLDQRTAVTAWIRWFESDPETAESRFDEARKADPEDAVLQEVMCHREPRAANRHADLADRWQARRGWVAAMLRSPYQNMAREAWNDLDTDGKLGVLSILDSGGHADAIRSIDGDDLDPEVRIGWLSILGRWEEVYAEISDTKKTLRAPLYQRMATAARQRGDIDIMLDALSHLNCSDMNSPGLRAMQEAFREIAGRHYRQYHP